MSSVDRAIHSSCRESMPEVEVAELEVLPLIQKAVSISAMSSKPMEKSGFEPTTDLVVAVL